MDSSVVLPVLLPGIVLQLSMQVHYIQKCWKDDRLTPGKRRLYAAMIALFSLPAVAVYLFKNGPRPPSDPTGGEAGNTAPYIRRGTFLLLATAYQVMGMHIMAENAGNAAYAPLGALLSASFLLMLLYNFLQEEKSLAASPLLPILQLLLCVPIQCIDTSGDHLFLSIIAGFSAINRAPLSKAKIYGIASLGTYLAGSTARAVFLSANVEMSHLVQYFFVNTLVVLLALLAFYTLKKQMVTSVRLESALHTVEEQAEQLKGLAVVQERNRIAAEMHDTVGHTLTAAVLSLEAAEGLISREPLEAAQRLRQGKAQVRRGLGELRASVRAVQAGGQEEFTIALERLLQEIHGDTGLAIQSVADSRVNLPPLQTGIVLSAVKECATNAIRHGRASRADILVQEHQGQLRLAFTDNGVGTAQVRPGSGLSMMRERVQSVGGTLEMETAPGEGCTVSLTIPAPKGKEDAP